MVPEIWRTRDIIFYHFGLFFALLPPNKPENQNSEKMKNTPGEIMILHLCTKTDDHMMHGSCDMEHNRHNIFVILD